MNHYIHDATGCLPECVVIKQVALKVASGVFYEAVFLPAVLNFLEMFRIFVFAS